MELTKDQHDFYLIWRLQGLTDYQIALYLSVLKEPDKLSEALKWIEDVTYKNNKFPTESEWVEQIHVIMRGRKRK